MKNVAVCETQPVTAEGLNLLDGAAMVREDPPDILIVDKGFGAHAVMAWIAELRDAHLPMAIVVWGNVISEAEALRLLQNGVKGIIRKTTDANSLLACLRAVASGTSWMEESLFREPPPRERYHRSELTPREQQVLELVEQGLKNKEIARELGIRPGTVKIHLKHIFEKTGVRGRYGLALSGMKSKGLLALPRV